METARGGKSSSVPPRDKEGADPDFEVKSAWRRSLVIATVTSFAALGLYISPLRSLIEDDFSRKIEYSVRTLLGRSVPLDPKIKMVAFEDYTASVMQRPDLSLLEWATVFEYLSANKPRVLFIDRIFGLPIGTRPGGGVTDSEAKEFIARMKATGVPIIAGSFFQDTSIVRRPEMNMDRPEYRLGVLLDENNNPGLTAVVESLPWMQVRKGFLYGPHPSIIEGFSQVGSINYEGNGYLRPLTRLSKDHVLVHTSIMIAGDLELRNRSFFMNNKELPISDSGRVTINLSDRETYYAQTKNLLSFIRKINSEEKDIWIEPGDIVAILPMMYTGNTDMKDVPVGRLQGSYINVSAINNALSGNWLREVPYGMLWILLAGFLGAVAGNLTQVSIFSAAAISAVAAQLALGFGLFAYAGRVFPWLFTSLGFLLCAVAVFVDRARRIEFERRRAVAKAEEGVRVRKLLHVVCHDIANPLMVLSARLSLLGGKSDAPKAEATNVDKATMAADRIRSIIESVKNLEAAETGKAAIKLEPVSLKKLFDAVPVSFEDTLAKKGVSVIHNLKEDSQDISVQADQTSLENFVVNNLVSNAIKFSQSGDQIQLNAIRNEGRVTIRIKDQGIGIPEALLSKIFSPTEVTTRAGTQNERGTGFGMPIVKSYIDRYGGEINIKSTSIDDDPLQHGTEISITLNEG